MTQPIVNTQPKEQPRVTYNAGLQAGVKEYGADKIALFGATGGAKVEYKGFHAGADVSVGTALGANLEVGKEFDINKNWGLDLSANASHTVSMLGKSQIHIKHDIQGVENTPYAHAEWRPGVTSAGVKAMANYTSNNGKFNFGVGVSGQYVKNNAADALLSTRYETEPGVTQIRTNAIKAHKEGVVVSPEVQFGYKINDKLALGLNADALGGSAGISYTF